MTQMNLTAAQSPVLGSLECFPRDSVKGQDFYGQEEHMSYYFLYFCVCLKFSIIKVKNKTKNTSPRTRQSLRVYGRSHGFFAKRWCFVLASPAPRTFCSWDSWHRAEAVPGLWIHDELDPGPVGKAPLGQHAHAGPHLWVLATPIFPGALEEVNIQRLPGIGPKWAGA